MELHLGRLIDHVHIVVSDLEKSRKFYKAILESIGKSLNNGDAHHFGSDEIFVTQATETSKLSHIHLAFQVPDHETVQAFHKAAIGAGGTENGAPGERPYDPGYYAAFILDPDGNNIEAVFHGPAERSAESILITPK
ncbi:MAG: VOC family protein [Bdellovibrionaceae bacterium]|nr:VOC family protein [Pseudobdellovibrionaceae bacterium]